MTERFWSKVDASGDCWEWTASTGRTGYGHVQVNKVKYRAHRFAWQILVGPIPDGMTLDHLCRNTSCVNPDHLEVVTRRENIARGFSHSAVMSRRDRCVAGHPFTPENTRWTCRRRICRTCNNARKVALRQRQRATLGAANRPHEGYGNAPCRRSQSTFPPVGVGSSDGRPAHRLSRTSARVGRPI